MIDPALRALSTLSDAEFAKHVANREARHAWAEMTGRPIHDRPKGGFPVERRTTQAAEDEKDHRSPK